MYKVFAVILNWNSANDTIRCAKSLQKAKKIPDQIIVVDNGSTDDSLSVLTATLSKHCHIIQTVENMGYAGGMHVGVKYCLNHGADLIWLMNNDIVVQPDTLSELLESVKRNGLWCMYSPKIMFMSEPDRIYFAGKYFNTTTGNFNPYMQLGEIDSAKEHTDLLTEVIQGANVLVPAKIISSCGFMDEDYFLYYEEFDYSLRLAKKGIKCICVLSATVFHEYEGTTKSCLHSIDNIRLYYRLRNIIILWRRLCPMSSAVLFTFRHVINQIKIIAKAGNGEKIALRYRLQALWHGIIGKTGRTYEPK